MLDSPATKTSVQNGKARTAHTKAGRNLMAMARGMIAGRGQPQERERASTSPTRSWLVSGEVNEPFIL